MIDIRNRPTYWERFKKIYGRLYLSLSERPAPVGSSTWGESEAIQVWMRTIYFNASMMFRYCIIYLFFYWPGKQFKKMRFEVFDYWMYNFKSCLIEMYTYMQKCNNGNNFFSFRFD